MKKKKKCSKSTREIVKEQRKEIMKEALQNLKELVKQKERQVA